jgi:hypothetical protein
MYVNLYVFNINIGTTNYAEFVASMGFDRVFDSGIFLWERW